MKPQVILLSAITLVSLSAASQPAAGSAEMDALFARNRYAATWSYYQQQLQRDSLNSELNYKMGVCYLNSRSQQDKAVACFKRVLALQNNKPQSALTYKLLADASYLARNFEQALTYYEAYKKTLLEAARPDSAALRDINKQLEICALGKELNDLKLLTSTLIAGKAGAGDEQKAAAPPDYTVSAAGELLTFTFRRPSFSTGSWRDKELFDDSRAPQGDTSWADTRDTGRVQHEATVATSIDGQMVLLYRDDEGDAALYVSTLQGNIWTTPERVNRSLNLQGWEPNEYISPDGHTLYFTSSRDGGYGGKDIYRSILLPGGEWSKAVNLGYPINSPYDDEAPFIHPDGHTLFFSSNRQRKEGFDIFSCTLEEGKWSAPVNIGYPVSKAIDPAGIERTVNYTEKDNCLVTFLNQKKNPLVLVKGSVTTREGRIPSLVQVTVSDNATGEIMGVYQTNRNGQYVILLPGGRNNNLLFEADGFLFHSENLDISEANNFYRIIKPVVLEPFTENATTVLNNVFFKGNPPVLHSDSQKELHHLFRLMASHPGLVVEIGGFCADDTKAGENSRRKEEQVQSICKQLLENGIDKERVQTRVYSPATKKRKRKKNKVAPESDRIELKIVKLNPLK
jgi:hypothetical protein